MSSKSFPKSIQWMPPGENIYRPGLPDGEEPADRSKPRRVIITPLTCLKISESIQANERKGNYSFIDIEHDWSNPAAVVRSAYWGGDCPKTGGVRLEVIWTDAGSKALLAGLRRFSPEFLCCREHPENLEFDLSLGGITSRPANKNIAPIMATSFKDFRRYLTVVRDEKILDIGYDTAEMQDLIEKERPCT